MLPENKLSTTYVPGSMIDPDGRPYLPLVSYEKGGVALQNPSKGLLFQDWTCRYDKTDSNVYLEAPNIGQPLQIFTQADIVHLSFCFDQNMRWACAYELASGACEFRWYDSQAAAYVITPMEAGCSRPFLTMDDKRANQTGQSDILLTYLAPSVDETGQYELIVRTQRERFLIRTVLATGINGTIYNFGMTNKLRVQWDIYDFDNAAIL